MSTIVNSLGSGSGIDTKALVDNLVAAQRDGTDRVLTKRKEAVAARISALGQVTSAVNGFASALRQLTSSGSLGAQAVSGDPATLGISFVGASVPLASSVSVERLAAAQTTASDAIVDATAPVGQGTLTITLGTVTADNAGKVTGFVTNPAKTAVTVTIGPDNDSLTGVARAINAANAGVTASVVKDASGSRLVLKGATGAAQGFTVGATADLAEFAFEAGSGGTTLKAGAQDSRLLVDGVAVERSSNTLSDVIVGVTLDLKRADPGKPIALSTTRDNSVLTQAVNDYVATYNELQGLIAEMTKTATEDGEAGALRGDRAVRQLQAQLRTLNSTRLFDGEGASFAEIGVRTNRDGTLSVDAETLSAAVTASPSKVEALFVATQNSDSPFVTVGSATGRARAGTYQVTDIVPATQGKLSGTSVATAFDTPVDVDATNKIFRVTLDGKNSLDLTIAEGSYATGAALAAAMQAAINADPVLKAFDKAATVSWSGSALEIRSRSFGSSSSIAVSSLDPTLAARVGLAAPTSALGTNVAGKINGTPAVGIGTRLIASLASPAAGLALEVQSGATSAKVVISGGVSGAMTDIFDRLGKGDGALASASAQLVKEQRDIADRTAKLDRQSSEMRDRLTREFARMEAAVTAFKATQTYLEQQIDAWNAGRD
jgi:flagellar hook-associated protein 2